MEKFEKSMSVERFILLHFFVQLSHNCNLFLMVGRANQSKIVKGFCVTQISVKTINTHLCATSFIVRIVEHYVLIMFFFY